VKNPRRGTFVVAGWYPGEGGRETRIGSLLLGYYGQTSDVRRQTPELLYAGKVGTGFTEKELERLQELLAPLRRDDTPFAGPKQPQTGAVFCEPRYVAAVEYTEFTNDRTLRHPAYKGLVEGADPRAVVCAIEKEDG
jgi:bifunctional non-homologous end joining protein LigD